MLEKLATGGSAEIYLAYSASGGSNKFVAIKKVLPQLSNEPRLAEMFKEEVRLTRNLEHSNIVSASAFGCENNQEYLVMDYIEGITLQQLQHELKATKQKTTSAQALYIVKEIAAGLEYIHQCVDRASGEALNIVHRDLCPQNIMITFRGAVKIIDFGIAKLSSPRGPAKSVDAANKGRLGYMSPEQRNNEKLDARSDLFSLGVILLELLTGGRTFAGALISNASLAMPAELDVMVKKMLAKDRHLRYQSAAEIHRDLNKLLNQLEPDFSKLEFSNFIKSFLKEAYEGNCKKLAQYQTQHSKIIAAAAASSAQLAKKEVSTAVVFEPIEIYENSNATNKTKTQTSAAESLEDLEFPDGLGGALNTSRTPNEKPEFEKLAKKTVLTKSLRTQENDDIFIKTNQFQQTQLVVKEKEPPFERPIYAMYISEVWRWFAKLAFLGIFILVAQRAYIKYSATVFSFAAKLLEAPNAITATEEDPVRMLTTEKNEIVETRPSIDVGAHPIAYANITVSDKSPSVKIAVNGTQILDRPPVIMFPIMAEKIVVISAYNPVTKKYAERRLLARAKTSLKVHLDLSGHKAK